MLVLMQPASLCQDEHEEFALLLAMVLAKGQGVCRMPTGRKVSVMRQLGRSQTLNIRVRNGFQSERFLHSPISQRHSK